MRVLEPLGWPLVLRRYKAIPEMIHCNIYFLILDEESHVGVIHVTDSGSKCQSAKIIVAGVPLYAIVDRATVAKL